MADGGEHKEEPNLESAMFALDVAGDQRMEKPLPQTVAEPAGKGAWVKGRWVATADATTTDEAALAAFVEDALDGEESDTSDTSNSRRSSSTSESDFSTDIFEENNAKGDAGLGGSLAKMDDDSNGSPYMGHDGSLDGGSLDDGSLHDGSLHGGSPHGGSLHGGSFHGSLDDGNHDAGIQDVDMGGGGMASKLSITTGEMALDGGVLAVTTDTDMPPPATMPVAAEAPSAAAAAAAATKEHENENDDEYCLNMDRIIGARASRHGGFWLRMFSLFAFLGPKAWVGSSGPQNPNAAWDFRCCITGHTTTHTNSPVAEVVAMKAGAVPAFTWVVAELPHGMAARLVHGNGRATSTKSVSIHDTRRAASASYLNAAAAAHVGVSIVDYTTTMAYAMPYVNDYTGCDNDYLAEQFRRAAHAGCKMEGPFGATLIEFYFSVFVGVCAFV